MRLSLAIALSSLAVGTFARAQDARAITVDPSTVGKSSTRSITIPTGFPTGPQDDTTTTTKRTTTPPPMSSSTTKTTFQTTTSSSIVTTAPVLSNCPTVISTGTVCATCLVPDCPTTTTLTNPCTCPTPVATVTTSYPCGADDACVNLGCKTTFKVSTAAC